MSEPLLLILDGKIQYTDHICKGCEKRIPKYRGRGSNRKNLCRDCDGAPVECKCGCGEFVYRSTPNPNPETVIGHNLRIRQREGDPTLSPVRYRGSVFADPKWQKQYGGASRYGESHPNWKPDYDPKAYSNPEFQRVWPAARAAALERDVSCRVCQGSHYLVVHHIDENIMNNELENLIVLCASHHRLVHERRVSCPTP